MRFRFRIGISWTLTILTGVLASGCKLDCPSADGSVLDISLTGANSPEEIKNKVKASLEEKYPSTYVGNSYTIYQVTNGPARWIFAKVYNAPRGLSMYNLYCYEQEGPESWVLRGYVPLNAHSYTNSDDWRLRFQTDGEYVKVVFRERIIFTGISKLGLTNGTPLKSQQ